MHYETVTKPALRQLEKLTVGRVAVEDLSAVQAVANAAVDAGASVKDIHDAVGGHAKWVKLAKRVRAAGLL